MLGLGRLYDIVPVIAPKDLDASASTGLRVSLRKGTSVDFVIFAGAGTAPDDLQIDVQEHSAATGGTSRDLDVVTEYWYKNAATLANGTDRWVKAAQSAASEIADVGGAGTSAETQNLCVVHVDAGDLSDGYEYVSVNIPDLGAAGAKYGCALAIVNDLIYQGAPESFPANLP